MIDATKIRRVATLMDRLDVIKKEVTEILPEFKLDTNISACLLDVAPDPSEPEDA